MNALQHIANELGWVIRPGTRVNAQGFANMIRRMNTKPEIESLCQILDNSSATFERTTNGNINLKIH